MFDWFFRNRRTGQITIGEFPNLPLFIFIGCFALGWILDIAGQGDSAFRTGTGVVGMLALLWWALDELIRGVNPWRRVLGAVVTVFVLVAAYALVTG
ncbi:MAG: hypothetical protein HQ526_07935 [Actinobacteria bacterium]|nr:hypothetical protein [Actinomycetota bacterium]